MLNIGDKVDNTAGATGELSADEYNDHKNELQESVTRSGQTLSDTLTPDQLSRAMFINGTSAERMQDSGTANAIQLTPITGEFGLGFPSALSQMDGVVLSFSKASANTSGTITVNVGQTTGTLLPARSLTNSDGTNPEIGAVNGECKIRFSVSNDRWEFIEQGELKSNFLNQQASISTYNAATDYSTAGQLVDAFGLHYSSSGRAANTGNNPLLPENGLFWVQSPGIRELIKAANNGEVWLGGMHPHSDYNDADYQQNLLLDQAVLGGTTYNFYKVSLDATVVTSNTTLEDDIFRIGQADEYIYADLFCPDDLGTRTLVDARGALLRAIDATGGMADTLAERKEDALQKVTGNIYAADAGGTKIRVFSGGNGSLIGTLQSTSQALSSISASPGLFEQINFDNSQSTSPNAAKTDDEYTRDKSVTVGVPYIIVMVAA